jgi:hypothetical protein
MADNFDLKKFLKESKALENLNPILNKENINEGDIRDKIKEMILAELDGGEDYELEGRKTTYDINPEMEPYEDEEEWIYEPEQYDDEDLREAKKKKDEEEAEDVETTDVDVTDTIEDLPTEDAPKDGGGLEDIAADMEGTEGDLMDALMKALKISKGMGNEKLTTQIGNTLKFFVGEYIGGDNM